MASAALLLAAPTTTARVLLASIVTGVAGPPGVRKDDFHALYDDAVRSARATGDGYSVVTPEHLMAMKLAAARPKDREDALWLLQQKGLVSRGRARRIVHQFLGGQLAAQRLDRWFSIADWRVAHGEESDPGEEED